MRTCSPEHPLRIAILISGNGSNLQAIIDAINDGMAAEIRVVVSDQETAYGLERAKRADIPTEVLSGQEFTSKAAYDNALRECLKGYQPELIILAGFMRILGADFVEYFKNKIINIHPSLLPKYPGMHTHQQALAAHDKIHGATVHVVTQELDSGPIIAQAALPISPDDDAHSLKHKVHTLEHKLYPEIVQLYAEGRLEFKEHTVLLDGEALPSTGLELRVHY